MQPSHTRLICRAHNRFTPSIALWQHFVVPTRPATHQQRHLSSATGVAEDSADTIGTNASGTPVNAQEASGLQQLKAKVKKSEKPNAKPAFTIRRKTTNQIKDQERGQFYPNKRDASIQKNKRTREVARDVALAESDKLLATARAAYDDAKEYTGVVVKPIVNATPVKESALPWCLKTAERTVAGMDRLNIEIERFYEYTKPNRYESIARKHVIEQVREHVRTGLSEYVVEVFGSERTGIALATSDIDFRLVRQSRLTDPATANLPPTPEERKQAFQALHRLLYSTIQRHKNTYLLATLRHARYPLISAQDRESGLDLQIVLSNDTSVSRDIMQGYMGEYPYLRQLYYVVKTMFDVRGLSDVFRGGFGSYSLFMMVVASLKHAPHPREDAAGGLINFLRFWRDFDTRKRGISIEPAFLFNKAEHQVLTDKVKQKIEGGAAKPLPEYMLSLRDPADETNDLGRKGIAIKHVQVTFRDLSFQLEFDMRVNARPSILGPLVGTSYMHDYARRGKLREHGQKLLQRMQKSLSAKAKAIREAEKLKAEEEEMLRQIEEEQKRHLLAKEQWDKEQQKEADERNERSRMEAQKASVLEHGEAMASILGMPSVEEEEQAREDVAAPGQPTDDSNKA